MKIYTIENGTINEHDVTESMPNGFMRFDKSVGCDVYVRCDDAYTTWGDAHAALVEAKRRTIVYREIKLNAARRAHQEILNMKEPKR